MANAAAQFALAQVGKPYQWGAAGPKAFDCSGLVMKAYGQLDIYLPHQSGQQASWFNQRGRLLPNTLEVRNKLLPGDVVFYYGTINAPLSITHCGVYVRRPMATDKKHLIVAAVDDAHGVMEHRMNWALAPCCFGLNRT